MSDQKKLGALLTAQDWTAAERLLRRLAKGKAPPPEVFYNLAKVLEAAGKPDQMAVWLKRAVAANPRYAVAWFELGRVALGAGDLEEAYVAFQHAVNLKSNDADARRNLGRIAMRLGKWVRPQPALRTSQMSRRRSLATASARKMGYLTRSCAPRFCRIVHASRHTQDADTHGERVTSLATALSQCRASRRIAKAQRRNDLR
ncbi:tetratricopeptide repeat protein [Sulfitobacter sp.]|uniref:tetratricopeptide repeat protein n=1 Tax=Sulfitobacter sp. TaxID=1903071 RepID=UPI0030013109